MRLIGVNIAAERGDDILFSGLHFTLSAGQLLTVTGPNGIGKSTLLRIIAGLLTPLAGKIEMEEDGHFFSPSAWCHYLSAQNAMKPSLSVYDNLQFWAHFLGNPLLSPQQALMRVGIGHIATLPYRVLSTGQKRRAALARLLVSHRPLWLLDEPTSGLDKEANTLVATLMKEHMEKGGMIIAATHLPLGVNADHQCHIADFRHMIEEDAL